MMVSVTLDEAMLDYADHVAAGRRYLAWHNNRTHTNGLTGDFDLFLANDRLGTRTEVAGKRYLNPIKWNAIEEKITHLPDLINTFVSVDVKGIRKKHHKLIVDKDDENEFAFLLVSAFYHPTYEIVGWLWGHEAKQEEFWSDPKGGRPAYFVPQTFLRPPEELLKIAHPINQRVEA